MKRLTIFLLLFGTLVPSFAQSYDDVAILINTNSAKSLEIGSYFQSKHAIPVDHVISLPMPVDTVLSLEEARQILNTINPILASKSNINYIVTTLDCPKSFDSEVGAASLDISFESLIQNGTVNNVSPTLNFNPGEFTHDEYGIYIVSRLEARTLKGTKELIDRGGKNTLNIDNPLILDIIQVEQSFDSLGMEFVNGLLSSWKTQNEFNIGIPIEPNEDDSLAYAPFTNLSGYFGMINGDFSVDQGEELICKAEGVAVLLNPFGFLSEESDSYLSTLDFVEGFCHGGVGTVDQYYITQMNRTIDLYKWYYNQSLDFNLGESHIKSHESYLKTPFVLYGDPKSTVSFLSSVDNFIPSAEKVNIFPNPCQEFIELDVDGKTENFSIELFSIDGKRIASYQMEKLENKRIDVSNLPVGEYVLYLSSPLRRESQVLIKH